MTSAHGRPFTKDALSKAFNILRRGAGRIVKGLRVPANWRNVKSAGSDEPGQVQQRFHCTLEQLDRILGAEPGRLTKPVVLVEDNGPILVS